MQRLHHRDHLSFSATSSLLPGALWVAIFFLSLSHQSSGLVLPQPRTLIISDSPSTSLIHARDEETTVTGPGLLSDLTLPLGAGIGCIVGVYAGSLLLVGTLVAALLPTRRRALENGTEEVKAQVTARFVQDAVATTTTTTSTTSTTTAAAAAAASASAASADAKASSPTHALNFSYPSPRHFVFPPEPPHAYINKDGQAYEIPAYDGHLSQSSICLTPISDPLADHKEVMENRQEAHEQLADLYKLVLQHDEERHSPQSSNTTSPIDATQSFPRSEACKEKPLLKKHRLKPTSLSLYKPDAEKRKSRGGALLSAILSPRRKAKALSISSPLMTPMTPNPLYQDPQEMLPLSPRHYIPKAPPPVPVSAVGFTPEQSPPGSPRGTIDERLNPQLAPRGSRSSLRHARQQNSDAQEGHEQEEEEEEEEEQEDTIKTRVLNMPPASPGLPLSPRTNATRFSGLPQSPKPGATFQNQVPTSPVGPTAVRRNGALALRAYEPMGGALLSPQFTQTTFERTGMLSPTSPGAVPYTPYQPFTPCFPMSPTLVTKEDRRRLRRLEPKTPTVELVQSNEDIW